MGGTVDISGDIEGDVAVFGGNLGITGVVVGDAAVMGGTVHHSGTIEGDLFVIGGTVDLDSGSTVGGDIGLVGGDVNRDDGAVVEGEVKAVPMEQISKLVPGLSKMFRFGHILPKPRVFVGFFSLAWLIVLFILTLLPLVIFPDAMDHIVRRIEDELWISAAIGFGFQICIAPILLLFIVSIIGWLLIPIFCLGMVVAALFGFAALCRVVGDRLTSGFHWSVSSPVGLFTLGWLAVMLILIIGSILAWLGGIGILVLILGWTIIYIASTIGTGATIYALFKSAK
jgi:cytoskeletal protein CcmA (bactofilin family)